VIRRAVLVGITVAFACGQKGDTASSPKPGAATCDALLLSSLEARALRDQAGGQFAAVGRALARADLLQNQTLPAEEVGTDTYASAIQRAFSYKQTGVAVCQAARLVDEGMLELAMRSFDGPEWRRLDERLTRTMCQLRAQVDGGPSDRRDAATEWSSQSRDAREFEDRLVQACYEKNGGVRPEFHLMPPLLPSEQ
jgi:hypothetical protein